MKTIFKNFFFPTIVLLISALLFYWLKNTQDNTLRFLLYPHAKAAEIFYNIHLDYFNGEGYVSLELPFAIGPNCLGGKFIVLLFAMLASMFINYFNGINKLVFLIVSFLYSIFVGIFISCMRIISSIPFVLHEKFILIHSVIGISFYFLALVLSYILANRACLKITYMDVPKFTK